MSQNRLDSVLVVAAPLSRDPVSWVQMFESRAVARELRRMGFHVRQSVYRSAAGLPTGSSVLLLRLSDALMGKATAELHRAGVPYAGPSHTIFERCYDKLLAYQTAKQINVPYPETYLASDHIPINGPILLKPRRGSDSLGIRIVQSGKVPPLLKREDYLVQPFIHGIEITIAVLGTVSVGLPLQILRPAGAVYSFGRKNLSKTKRMEVKESRLAQTITEAASKIAVRLQIDWAARVDMLYDPHKDVAYFLECDACPTISEGSSFAKSLSLAGIGRPRQIDLLLHKEKIQHVSNAPAEKKQSNSQQERPYD